MREVGAWLDEDLDIARRIMVLWLSSNLITRDYEITEPRQPFIRLAKWTKWINV